MISERHGQEVSTVEAQRILNNDTVNFQPDPKDWIKSFNTQQREEILALMSGGVSSSEQASAGGGFWGGVGRTVGSMAVAYAGAPRSATG